MPLIEEMPPRGIGLRRQEDVTAIGGTDLGANPDVFLLIHRDLSDYTQNPA